MKVREVLLSAAVVAALAVTGGPGVAAADAGTTPSEVGGGCPDAEGAGPHIRLADDGAGRVRLTVPASATGDGQGVELATVAVSRGQAAVDTTVLGSTAYGFDAVTIGRAAFTETLRSTGDGVEQSWRFARPPAGGGDLSVAVALSDLEYLGRTANGLHLARAQAVELCYGDGVWIDAAGHRSPIVSRYQDGRILLTVPTQTLADSTYPAVLDPKIIVNPINT